MQGVAVVTGAATGIGAAITERLADKGMHLVLVARDGARLEAAAKRLHAEYGARVSTLALDLSQQSAPARLAKWLTGSGTEVDVLVNNAGASLMGPVANSDPARLRGLVDLNAGAMAELTALLLPAMVARGRGAVVNIASTGAYAPVLAPVRTHPLRMWPLMRPRKRSCSPSPRRCGPRRRRPGCGSWRSAPAPPTLR